MEWRTGKETASGVITFCCCTIEVQVNSVVLGLEVYHRYQVKMKVIGDRTSYKSPKLIYFLL